MIYLSGDLAADKLLTDDPLALVIGLVLDQQIPLERAFKSPFNLRERLGGTLDAAAIGSMDPEQLAAAFALKPALHRFPSSMAARVQQVCQVITEQYEGDASRIWSTATDGEALTATVAELPGFGAQKARIFVAFLGKQLGVRPDGWRQASAPFGDEGTFQSIADIDSPEALIKVRKYKQQLKAEAKAKAPAAR